MSRPYYGYSQPDLPEPGGRLPVALVFPGPSSLAYSTLGWQTVYSLLAERGGFRIERFFEDGGGEPRSADTGAPLDSFPLIAFSVNFEEEYRVVASMLSRAGIPLRSRDREGWPLVLAGGPVAFINPLPISPAVDCFWVGEAEAGLPDLLADLAGVWLEGGDKKEFLDRVKDRDGVWVPGASKTPVRRAVLPERELSRPAASCFLSSKAEFRDMLLLEINRGCPYACRFCAAGAVYRPPRRASTEKLKEVVERADPPKVGLVGTALTDWPDLLPFLRWLKERGTTFSLSSVRADGLTPELMEFLRKTGSRTLTLALEAPSKRLRTAAGKRLAEEDFLLAVERAAALRFNRLKIYLIVGWPGETGADYDELASFLDQVQAARDRGRGSRKSGLDLITLSLSPLVPKPWTPLQWAPMAPEAALSDRIKRIKAICKPLRGVRVEAETPFAARLQALLSRGDDRLFELVELAVEKGGWRAAIKAWDGDPADYLRERDVNERLPWDVIDLGVSPEHLKRQWEAYRENKPGTVCPPTGCEACRRCGMEAWVQGAQE